MIFAQKIIAHKLVRSMMALAIGYGLWSSLARITCVTKTYTVPLSFYQVPKHFTIDAPETIQVTLSAPRHALASIAEQLVLYINVAHFSSGRWPVTVTNKELFLPENIKLVNYSFAHITVKPTSTTL